MSNMKEQKDMTPKYKLSSWEVSIMLLENLKVNYK